MGVLPNLNAVYQNLNPKYTFTTKYIPIWPPKNKPWNIVQTSLDPEN